LPDLSDLDLARRFAPQVLLTADEDYAPIAADVFIDEPAVTADVRVSPGPGLASSSLPSAAGAGPSSRKQREHRDG
jgi:hypothetical protein